ncbi:oncostatin-M isoform X1 [Opisthocomus hoazin]|uniref:oncostatin-M isoform X1 n=1 Tax=Opisthocomus hoazin TaxID=30419 RepID=UPI003F52EE59
MAAITVARGRPASSSLSSTERGLLAVLRCPPSPSSSSPAVTKGLFILWAVPGQGGRPPQPPTLQQVQALVRHMAEDAQELFTFYEEDQRLAINNLCRTNHPPAWLRGPATGPTGLRGLRGPMARMAQALQDITRHQRDLNPPGAEILRRLASTHLKDGDSLADRDAPQRPSKLAWVRHKSPQSSSHRFNLWRGPRRSRATARLQDSPAPLPRSPPHASAVPLRDGAGPHRRALTDFPVIQWVR